jgi:hypothetical protein
MLTAVQRGLRWKAEADLKMILAEREKLGIYTPAPKPAISRGKDRLSAARDYLKTHAVPVLWVGEWKTVEEMSDEEILGWWEDFTQKDKGQVTSGTGDLASFGIAAHPAERSGQSESKAKTAPAKTTSCTANRYPDPSAPRIPIVQAGNGTLKFDVMAIPGVKPPIPRTESKVPSSSRGTRQSAPPPVWFAPAGPPVPGFPTVAGPLPKEATVKSSKNTTKGEERTASIDPGGAPPAPPQTGSGILGKAKSLVAARHYLRTHGVQVLWAREWKTIGEMSDEEILGWWENFTSKNKGLVTSNTRNLVLRFPKWVTAG